MSPLTCCDRPKCITDEYTLQIHRLGGGDSAHDNAIYFKSTSDTAIYIMLLGYLLHSQNRSPSVTIILWSKPEQISKLSCWSMTGVRWEMKAMEERCGGVRRSGKGSEWWPDKGGLERKWRRMRRRVKEKKGGNRWEEMRYKWRKEMKKTYPLRNQYIPSLYICFLEFNLLKDGNVLDSYGLIAYFFFLLFYICIKNYVAGFFFFVCFLSLWLSKKIL